MAAVNDLLLAAAETIYDAAPNPSLWPDALGKVVSLR